MARCSRCQKEFAIQGPPPPAGAQVICPQCAAVAAGGGPASPAFAVTPATGVPQNNTLALVGFILSLVGILISPLLLVGLIVSAIGLRKAPRGLAIAGMAVGAGGIALYALLFMAILLPALAAARTMADQAVSSVNERSIVQSCIIYAQDNNQQLPPNLAVLVAAHQITASDLVYPNSGTTPADLSGLTPAQLSNATIIAARLRGHCDYVYVGAGMVDDTNPDEIVVYERPGLNDGAGCNIGFGDDHVTWTPADEIPDVFNRSNAARAQDHLPPLAVPVFTRTHVH